MKNNKIVYLLILIMPIIDLITSLTSRFYPDFISLGVIVKGLLIILSFIYVFFYSKSKYKKISIYYYLFIILYILLYFIFKRELLDIRYIKNELTYLFKFMYFPIIFTSLLNYFDCHGFKKEEIFNVLVISLLLYVISIAVPTLLNINFKTYSNTEYAGSVGWFFSANEVSTILLLLFPTIYYVLKNNKLLAIILFIISLFTISVIGTKVTLFGIIIITFIGMIIEIINNHSLKNKNSIIVTIMFIITLLFMINNVSFNNMESLVDNNTEVVEIDTDIKNDELLNKYLRLKNIGITLLSNREVYAINLYGIYHNHFNSNYLFLGMGYSNTSIINNGNVEKLAEIDFIDIFFHMGLLALLIDILPFIFVLVLLIKNKKNYTVNGLYYILIILLTVGISSVAGHVYMAPAVSFYIILFIHILLNEFKTYTKVSINNNKIVILALHLGYGGVENAIVSKASMLKKEYDVEIVSVYKQKYAIPYKIDKNIKITYLMNTVSNREEFKNSLKNKEWLNAIKEGLKAIKILLLKSYLMGNYIINSDAKVIISTRYEFSKLLSDYGREDAIKIHEQHDYNTCADYIHKLDLLNNIDYIMPASNTLKEDYNKLLWNKNKLKYIPLSLNYYPSDKEVSKLDSNNIIAIGRLETVKGYSDLIDIMKLVVKKDSSIKLNIFGDGSERKCLEEKIVENNLESNIILHGFKTQEYIKKYLQDSSLYAMTSLSESFGLVVTEAFSYGIPCIAFSSAKGVLDMINSNNGILIDNRDLNKYADEIVKYFKLDATHKNKFGKSARKLSEKYSKNNVQKEWLSFINTILDSEELNMEKKKKVLFIASTGGHLNELMQLKPMFKDYNYHIITEKTKSTLSLQKDYGNKINYLVYGTKDKKIRYPFKLIYNSLKSLALYIKIRPKYIITTGTHTSVPMCYIGKLFGSKIIFIETYANSKTKTLSGRLIYPIANLFIVQWESMLELYPKAVYGGWIY